MREITPEKVGWLAARIPTIDDDQLTIIQRRIERAIETTDSQMMRLIHRLIEIEKLRRIGKSDNAKTDDSKAVDLPEVTLLPVNKQDDRMIVFGEVLVPDETDAHEDTVSAEEIERAAHMWLARYQDRGVQHAKIANSKMELFESYIAPADLKIEGKKVKRGTWLLMLHVVDKNLWEEIKKGEFTGFSMGGLARKVPTK